MRLCQPVLVMHFDTLGNVGAFGQKEFEKFSRLGEPDEAIEEIGLRFQFVFLGELPDEAFFFAVKKTCRLTAMSKTTGPAGEYYVLTQLAQRDYVARLTRLISIPYRTRQTIRSMSGVRLPPNAWKKARTC